MSQPTAHVKIFTTPWCPYCIQAKRLLDRKGVAYENIDVSYDREMRAKLAQTTGRTSVPQIFINGQGIGGYDDMNALDRRGELDPLLQQPHRE